MWGKKQRPVERPEVRLLDHFVNLPAGSCLKTENGYYYINKINGSYVRYKLKSKRIIDSWNFNTIIHSTESVFGKMKIMGYVGFRPGTLVKDISSGLFYIIDGGSRRKIEDPTFLEVCGVNPNDVLLVSHDEIELHKEGEVIK